MGDSIALITKTKEKQGTKYHIHFVEGNDYDILIKHNDNSLYDIIDSLNNTIQLSVGSKFLHQITCGEKQYSCKGSVLKTDFKVYDYVDQVAELSLSRKRGKTYIMILAPKTKLELWITTLFLIMQITKEKTLLN